MSSDIIRIHPVDPSHRPTEAAGEALRALVTALCPESDEVEARWYPAITFLDAGSGFDEVLCPGCGARIDTADWGDWMSDAYDGETDGFELGPLEMTCCGTTTTLGGLVYEAPQAFATFEVTARDPDRGPLADAELAQMSEALGTPVGVVVQHV